MRKYIQRVLLWLFVVNLGIAFGAGIYEQRVVIPRWENAPPQAWPNTGLEFWVYVTTVPLTLLTLANLVAAWLEQGPRRYWWLGAAAISVVERIATFSYFIPTMLWLQGTEDLPQAEVQEALSQWLLLDHGRHVPTLAGSCGATGPFGNTQEGYGKTLWARIKWVSRPGIGSTSVSSKPAVASHPLYSSSL